ncbi:MAG: HAMP domain-containing sensor histidine kinase [Syntrophaceae bacterium]
MYLRTLNRVRKTVGFRLTLWYSSLFILTSLILFGLTYLFLSSYAEQKDREIIRSEFEECAVQYQTKGMEALEKEVNLEKYVNKESPYYVRLAGKQNETLFLSIPDGWTKTDAERLKNLNIQENKTWTELKVGKGAADTAEFISERLSDGSFLQVGKNTEYRKDITERFKRIFASVMIPVALLGFAGGAFLAFRALRPIRDFINTVRFIDRGTMSARVPVAYNGDELDDLAILFNNMLERIESLINGMRAALDNVAHDLRTPLTRLHGTAELTLQSEADADLLREALMDCAEESQNVLTMLNTLMDISEAENGTMALKMEEVDLSKLIEDMVELYRCVAEDKNILVRVSVSEKLYLVCDHNRIRQVMANLLDNALKYTPAGGKIEIKADLKGQQAVIVFEDTGQGIPAEYLPKIWDRLYRGDKSRSQRGLGLGLSLVRAVVYAHQGSVEVESVPDKGSKFTVFLPAKNFA